MRAALTSLGTRTQTPSAMKECFKVSDLRTVLHQPSRFSIRLSSLRVTHPQLPGRPPSDFRPLPHPSTKSNFAKETCQAPTRESERRPTHRLLFIPSVPMSPIREFGASWNGLRTWQASDTWARTHFGTAIGLGWTQWEPPLSSNKR